MEGVHLSLIPELGNKVRRAFIEGVHLERVHLERVDCMWVFRGLKEDPGRPQISF